MKALRTTLLAVLALATSAALAKPPYEAFTGMVVSTDGNTLTINDDSSGERKVLLFGIDMPDEKQAFGKKAHEALAAKVSLKSVDVDARFMFREGCEVGLVYVPGPRRPRLINEELVREGFAWRDVQFDKHGFFTAAENDAREHKRGLWADPHPVPPWEFRRAKREGRKLE
jgi:micrococcal nuclease